MTRIIFIFIITLFSCSANNSNNHERTVNNTLNSRKDNLEDTPPSVEFDKNLKVEMICNVHQFSGNDIKNKKITKVTEYYSNDRLATVSYRRGYKETARMGRDNVLYIYDYKDTLLVQKRSSSNTNDSTKTILTYNQKGQLIKEVHYNFKKRMRANSDKGLGRSGGCLVTEDDYEKEESWRVISVLQYTYDSLGRKVESNAPSMHWNTQNRYTWSYNNKGQVKEHRSYDHDRLIWLEEYSYTGTDYYYTRIWFDNDSNQKDLKKLKYAPAPQFKFSFKTNKKGQVIEEIITDEKEEFYGRTITKYNQMGLIAKTIHYGKNNKPEMTHIYEYKR